MGDEPEIMTNFVDMRFHIWYQL